MAKKITASLKLKIPAGKATAAPPVGSTLGQYGVNMMDFINPFNEQTRDLGNVTVTAHISVYEDRTMSFRIVTQPTDDMIRAKLGIEKGSGKPNSEKIAKQLTQTQLREIAEAKALDMNTDDIDAVAKMVAGTARSMGVVVEA
ncbi:MAG: 50S ribosomal protein L11 [Candidatus Saccharibacteria bacterium]|jgi:large subunit ribosomal protein L11|nr:50S ribosomal protein L11 [Candidatus Saccharibacteria bacterium]